MIRQRIADQERPPGDRLPSRAQLAREGGVGENVIRRAQELLISLGVLEGRAGSGTYVAAPRERLRKVRSQYREQRGGSPFLADMSSLGKRGTWQSRTEAKVPALVYIAARLGIAQGNLSYVRLTSSWSTANRLRHQGVGSRTRSRRGRSSYCPRADRTRARGGNAPRLQRGAFVTRIHRTYSWRQSGWSILSDLGFEKLTPLKTRRANPTRR